MKSIWIGLGGALGTVGRYWLDGWVQRRVGAGFPWGTLVVNLVGSFALAFLMCIGLRTELLGPTARIALTTGVLGGFTTYSTFNYETLRYFQESAWGMGCANIAATVLGCLVAGMLGWAAGQSLAGA